MTLIDQSTFKQFDKLPPHAIEAEMCVLASMMLADRDKKLFAETRAKLTREACRGQTSSSSPTW